MNGCINKQFTLPKVGDKLYVPSKMYTSRGREDILGGLATVKDVVFNHGTFWLFVDEIPNHGFNLVLIMSDQEKLKAEFGDQVARPDPDNHPSANTGHI